MLRILRVIAENLVHQPAALRLPESVPTPEGFRGRVSFDPSRCLACGMCAYVCVSDAITGAQEPDHFTWAYEPGRCAFCARCAERCPGGALSMEGAPAPSYARLGELSVQQTVPFPACPDCGGPARPVTAELLGLAFDHATEETRSLLRCCERCRRKRTQRRMLAAATPAEEGKR